jgi:hypothetical protein
MEKSVLDWIALILVIIGGLNWGLVGLFGLDLVASIFGAGMLAKIVYVLVGLSALWMIYFAMKE